MASWEWTAAKPIGSLFPVPYPPFPARYSPLAPLHLHHQHMHLRLLAPQRSDRVANRPLDRAGDEIAVAPFPARQPLECLEAPPVDALVLARPLPTAFIPPP